MAARGRQQNDDILRILCDPSSTQSSTHSVESLTGLDLTVVFTNVPETLAALRKAAVLAHELGARIRILVPQVVPYPLPLDRPPVDLSVRLRHFHTLCEEGRVETRIEIKLCRDAGDCLVEQLNAQSLVVIGHRGNGFFGDAQRFARLLRRRGHQIVLVHQNAEPAVVERISYSRARLAVVVLLLAINSSCAITNLMRYEYPLSLAAVLFIVPPLLREMDRKNGRQARQLGPFEWSCLLAGMFFLVVFPAVIL